MNKYIIELKVVILILSLFSLFFMIKIKDLQTEIKNIEIKVNELEKRCEKQDK